MAHRRPRRHEHNPEIPALTGLVWGALHCSRAVFSPRRLALEKPTALKRERSADREAVHIFLAWWLLGFGCRGSRLSGTSDQATLLEGAKMRLNSKRLSLVNRLEILVRIENDLKGELREMTILRELLRDAQRSVDLEKAPRPREPALAFIA